MNAAYDLISRLRDLDGKLNAREQRVATYVLENFGSVVEATLGEVAAAAEVSEPTVIRFCRTLGCEGFKDFKLRLAQNVAVSLQYLENSNVEARGASPTLDRVLGGIYAAANAARGQIEGGMLDRAVGALRAARQLVFIGLGGGSSMVACEAANRFFRLGLSATAVDDGYLQRMRAAALEKGDVLFAISASGEARDVVSSVEIANQYGATTLCLTRPDSTLARLAELPIVIELPEDQDIFKPTASRIVHLAIIDTLATCVAELRPEETRERLRRIRASLAAVHGRTGPQPIGD
ncbi:MAG: MurR/RpiR family transcriptional regulator [Rhodobacteraceae bacterium]|uniref:MurR/RpiR family transcriptional regulator n=1 Tax=Amaricoccus sp. TaxID=1872485 RepID=UPI001D57CD7B|nr:MurR/RpiR family transcriptional regulator [Amaricoccus sp.]MCB1369635.1 MurR/RpiR family transcriptional regulator [Paracoccaceae bacterium]MCC0068112.1 MurR/RpiR family transcriptional regulator [Rhodovulum sp.]MCB1372980.1 MurR/RpiR family transcriptional regulator [Paracoccaceae bacterium]MCB1404667.1 MurR/RpiR family transcriptional regulator [Paracoccaceae bacterium]HRW14373.1 MurR/RpiR family transcriptional regulator [Amaricoccus sp.]